MKNKLWMSAALLSAALVLNGCKSDDPDPIPVTPPPPGTNEISPEVGGPEQPNMAFVDLNAKTTSTIARNSWDIAFNNGPAFRVALNFSNGVMVKQLNTSIMDSVKREDWLTTSTQMDLNVILNAGVQTPPPSWLFGTPAWIDNPNGSLDSTAIAEIAVSNASNNVYLITRGTNPNNTLRGMLLIQINRSASGNGYTVTLADTGTVASNKRTYNYTKQGTGFTGMDLSTGSSVTTAPAVWHLNFTNFVTLFPLTGPGSSPIPYRFADYVLVNTAEVQGYMTDTSTITYQNFQYTNIETNRLSNRRTFIGSGWRSIPQFGSPAPPSVRADRYYIIRTNDSAAPNGARFFKIRFIGLVNENGQRGYPKFEMIELNP